MGARCIPLQSPVRPVLRDMDDITGDADVHYLLHTPCVGGFRILYRRLASPKEALP